MLNSATGTPLDATWGANMAAGYTMEEVPTCGQIESIGTSKAISEKCVYIIHWSEHQFQVWCFTSGSVSTAYDKILLHTKVCI